MYTLDYMTAFSPQENKHVGQMHTSEKETFFTQLLWASWDQELHLPICLSGRGQQLPNTEARQPARRWVVSALGGFSHFPCSKSVGKHPPLDCKCHKEMTDFLESHTSLTQLTIKPRNSHLREQIDHCWQLFLFFCCVIKGPLKML